MYFERQIDDDEKDDSEWTIDKQEMDFECENGEAGRPNRKRRSLTWGDTKTWGGALVEDCHVFNDDEEIGNKDMDHDWDDNVSPSIKEIHTRSCVSKRHADTFSEWKHCRKKALRVLGVSENDVKVSLRFFLPRRMLYGPHFPATRTTVIMQMLRRLFSEELKGVRELILQYDCPPEQKQSVVPVKALRLLGAKHSVFGRHKALRILGETNHQIEETNARDLARLGYCNKLYPKNERWFQSCPLLGGHFSLSELCRGWDGIIH